MTRTASKWSMAVMVSVFALSAAVAFGATKTSALKIKAGTLTGVVADSAGKALTETSLTLMMDGKVVAQAKTDSKGAYTLADIAAGKYVLAVPGVSPMSLIAATDGETTTLKIVVPQQRGYAALTQTQWVWGGLGGAGVIAVATPVIANNSGGGSSHDDNVSP